MKKDYRIKKNEDFSKIISQKRSYANQYFIIYYSKNNLKHARVGVSVSKKLGNAVVRNKIKRQLRMMIQENFHFQDSMDYIVIVRNNFLKQNYQENKNELNKLYLRILKRMVS